MKDCLEALNKAITQLQAHMHTTNAPIRPREALSKFNTSAPMMLEQLPSIGISTAQCIPPMPTEADVVAWEATTQQSDAYTEALTIVNEIETNPAIGIPTPHPLYATDSDVYAMDLEIEHVTSEQTRVSMQATLRWCT
jgi:Txe/YoeB family toxin of Txe-Axe toxin-antitoxin module